MKKGIFRKAEFYSCMRIDGKNKPVKHKGYIDGEYQYYNKDGKTWYAINYHTGLAICCGDTLDECYQKVHSKHFQKFLEEVEKSETYTKDCSDWYKALIKVGAIIENLISS